MNNISRFNQGDGITLYESPYNILVNNKVQDNKGTGHRIRNSWDIDIIGGETSLNREQAFIVYQDDLSHTARDFELDPVTPRASIDVVDMDLESNGGILKIKGFASVSLKGIDLDKGSITGSDFFGDLKPMSKKIEKAYRKDNQILLISDDTVPDDSKTAQVNEEK
jgi:parallel beta-helix repeat protein